jgi:DNA polymerase III alpha subunit (gram-positive type)
MKTEIKFPDKHYVIFDFETTGLDPDRDKVIEVAALKIFEGQVKDEFGSLIKIEERLPEKITEITGITDDMLQSGGNPLDVWTEFFHFIGNYALIGHNVINFDRLFLQAAFPKYGLPVPNKYRYLDTAMLFKARKLKEHQRFYENHFSFAQRVGEIRAPGVYFNLAQACKDLRVDTTNFTAHRAAGDVGMTNKVYQQLLRDGLIYEDIRPSIAVVKKKEFEFEKSKHTDKLLEV